MALIKCPSCQKEVSQNAVQYINCGEPIAGAKTESITGMHALFVAASIPLGGVLAYVASMKLNTSILVAGIVCVLPIIIAMALASMPKKKSK